MTGSVFDVELVCFVVGVSFVVSACCSVRDAVCAVATWTEPVLPRCSPRSELRVAASIDVASASYASVTSQRDGSAGAFRLADQDCRTAGCRW